MDDLIRIYSGQRAGKDSHYIAGPQNELLYPLFAFRNKQLFVSDASKGDPITGTHQEDIFHIDDLVTLSPKEELGVHAKDELKQPGYQLHINEVHTRPIQEYFTLFTSQPRIQQQLQELQQLPLEYSAKFMRENTTNYHSVQQAANDLFHRLK